MDRERRTRRINLCVLGGYALLVAGRKLLGLPCLIKALTGYPCPGCGMTGAWLCAIRLDFAGAFMSHPMFWAVPLVMLALLLPSRMLRGRAFSIAGGLIAAGFLANWIVRLLHA